MWQLYAAGHTGSCLILERLELILRDWADKHDLNGDCLAALSWNRRSLEQEVIPTLNQQSLVWCTSLLLQPPPPPRPFLRPFFRDHPGEPVPEENFWTSWCKGSLTEADTPTIRLGATPSGLTSVHLHHPHFYRPDALPTAQPTVSKHWRYASLLLQITDIINRRWRTVLSRFV